ncbi:MAG: DNA repair protein RecO [Desulfobacterales bacterium]|nr:DNA repair protein RecO [Desulfobacterales bacterium]MBF0396982.1 DNA repair protein RecO [Desulfobacterales bacterium]
MPSNFSTPAILIRRIGIGDSDLIVKLITLNKGKISVVAKSAKKSVKRFAGVLELFSALNIVYTISSRSTGIPILKEASVDKPFFKIRGDFKKTAYASYWSELINEWIEEGEEKQGDVYSLLLYVLEELDRGIIPTESLSIFFQMRFMLIAGFGPNLRCCSFCKTEIDDIQKNRILFSIVKGGIVCEKCRPISFEHIYLSKGTIKQLQWVENKDIKKAIRVRFTDSARQEGLRFLEMFVPYYIGKDIKSLKFLKEIRKNSLCH